MANSDNCRQALIPSVLYSSSLSSSSSRKIFDLDSKHDGLHQPPLISKPSPSNGVGVEKNFVIPSPKEKIEMFSPTFYAACAFGGMLSCGLTHTAVTPLDVVKCNMQV